ncbi:MAG: hypothetical protein HY581_02330 [Nitrospirae bacterium]|nr:hypothetical protein [Nitrospirota bacterium]
MTEARWHALEELAVQTAVYVERAPGRAEKRLVLFKAFVEAHQLNAAVTDDPDLILLDTLLQQPDLLIQHLQELWMKGLR